MLNFRNLLKTETAADIAAALATIDLPALRTALEAARTTRAQMLLSGNDAEVIAAEAAAETARLESDRAEAAVAELTRRHSAAVESERVAQLNAKRSEIVRERDDVVKALEKDYPKHANALTDLLGKIAQNNARIHQFNMAADANRSGEEFLIDRGAESVFLKADYNPAQGNILTFANIPAVPGVAGFWGGRSH